MRGRACGPPVRCTGALAGPFSFAGSHKGRGTGSWLATARSGRWAGPGTGEGAAALRWGGRLRRLPCGACANGPRQNSLHSLRSLRSDSCRESDHEAGLSFGRPAARPRCAPRHPTGAPPRPHRYQGLQWGGIDRLRPRPLPCLHAGHALWRKWRRGNQRIRRTCRRTDAPDAQRAHPRVGAGPRGRRRLRGRRGAQGGRAAGLPKDRPAS